MNTCELYVEDPQSDHCLPLFGQFCHRLASLPYCCEEEVLSGDVELVRQGCQTKSVHMWASLMDWHLSLWTSRAHKDAARQAFIRVPVNRDTSIIDNGEMAILAYQMIDLGIHALITMQKPRAWC